MVLCGRLTLRHDLTVSTPRTVQAFCFGIFPCLETLPKLVEARGFNWGGLSRYIYIDPLSSPTTTTRLGPSSSAFSQLGSELLKIIIRGMVAPRIPDIVCPLYCLTCSIESKQYRFICASAIDTNSSFVSSITDRARTFGASVPFCVLCCIVYVWSSNIGRKESATSMYTFP